MSIIHVIRIHVVDEIPDAPLGVRSAPYAGGTDIFVSKDTRVPPGEVHGVVARECAQVVYQLPTGVLPRGKRKGTT